MLPAIIVFALLFGDAYVFSLAISIFALIFSVLSYTYRISPSLSARLETQVLSGSDPRLNYGGEDPLTPGEEYLDLIIVNGGPGVAKKVTWRVEICGYLEKDQALSGTIPVLEPIGKVNVQGYLKVYHHNRKKIRDDFRTSHKYPPEEKLSNEDVKEIEKRTRKIEKYRIHLSHQDFFNNTRGEYILIFNEEGGFIGQESN